MKIKFEIIALCALLLGATSCKKDNYKAPDITLNGKLVYNGEAIGVEAGRVSYELYQYGFGKVGPIGSSFDQEGKYSAVLFNGEYKFIIPNGQGPFMWKKLASGAPDSLIISLSGNQTKDIEVTPYYMVRNANITAAGGKVSTTFKVEKIINDANAKSIEKVSLFINKTQFVSASGNENIASASIDGGSIVDMNNVAMNVTIPAIVPTQNYVFARVGVKISGVEDWLLSPLVKLTF